MSLPETVSFDNRGHIERFPWFRKIFLALIIVLVTSLAFGLGRLSVVNSRGGIEIKYDESIGSDTKTQTPSQAISTKQTATAINATLDLSGEVVASKNGTKYHYPYCSGAKQISEKNKITFASAQAAEDAGYTLASNCKPR